MSAITVLNQAADLLEQPGAWTQREYATDALGLPVPVDSKLATAWCLGGAMRRVNGGLASFEACAAIARITGEVSLIGYNDAPGRTQAEVVDVARRAAVALSKGRV